MPLERISDGSTVCTPSRWNASAMVLQFGFSVSEKLIHTYCGHGPRGLKGGDGAHEAHGALGL